MNITDKKHSVLVWDFPVRVFHWLLVVSFAGAWITSESEAQQMFHYAFGYSACGLILFRIIWGIVGTKYARFTQFCKGPVETIRHIKSLLSGSQHHGLGHNPAGALAMITLMVLVLLIGLTGYWSVKELFADLANEAHEAIASLAMGIVVVHVAAAIIMSFMQKENLIQAMVTGKKQGNQDQGIRFPMYFVGIGLIVAWIYTFYLVVRGSLPALTQ
ncbi:cytochrome b/b6 domain-containing protein [Polynucleobacter sp. MWH-Aus1W21]|uniref:cytochrome b/b6 domain-containing protein n=1 Tax=Polynucleobacter sp. MWH-Aus1W21 TaxID=1855880 RepID=UPI001BFEC049|nr:cytochrome b/b6 domain-containing protein [Polynucleobacter sp. MWH-Aus1W21]QWD67146.1 cytochrome b/b6 domain-containing protein [Polynucleobacter sp. MWH-Aus1W21]